MVTGDEECGCCVKSFRAFGGRIDGMLGRSVKRAGLDDAAVLMHSNMRGVDWDRLDGNSPRRVERKRHRMSIQTYITRFWRLWHLYAVSSEYVHRFHVQCCFAALLQ